MGRIQYDYEASLGGGRGWLRGGQLCSCREARDDTDQKTPSERLIPGCRKKPNLTLNRQ